MRSRAVSLPLPCWAATRAFAATGACIGPLALELFQNVLHDASFLLLPMLLGGTGDGVKSPKDQSVAGGH